MHSPLCIVSSMHCLLIGVYVGKSFQKFGRNKAAFYAPTALMSCRDILGCLISGCVQLGSFRYAKSKFPIARQRLVWELAGLLSRVRSRS